MDKSSIKKRITGFITVPFSVALFLAQWWAEQMGMITKENADILLWLAIIIFVGGIAYLFWPFVRKERRNLDKLVLLYDEGARLFNQQLATDNELDIWKQDYRKWYDEVVAIVKKRYGQCEYLQFKTLVGLSNSRWKFQYNEDHRQHLIAFDAFLIKLKRLLEGA